MVTSHSVLRWYFADSDRKNLSSLQVIVVIIVTITFATIIIIEYSNKKTTEKK